MLEMLASSQISHAISLDRYDNRRVIIVRLLYCGMVEEEKAQTNTRTEGMILMGL